MALPLLRGDVSDFGDFENDDALDTEPADAEQVAIRLAKYQRDDDPSLPTWDELDDAAKLRRIAIIVRVLAWLRRQGAFR